MVHTAVVLYMIQDINDEAGIYLEYKETVKRGRGGDKKVILFNYHDDAKFLCELVKKSDYKSAIFILLICQEQFKETENIKEINRYSTPFWFPFRKNKFRDINLFIFIELVKLMISHKEMKLEVSASMSFLDIAIGYLNDIGLFDSKIKKLQKNKTNSPKLSYQSLESIRRILANIHTFSSYIFYDLDNIPKRDQNEPDRKNTCCFLDVFVRNSKTKDSRIKKKENIIVVPDAKDSADIIIILMMTITAKESEKNATICVKSGDDIFPKAQRYILINEEYNQNVSIINPHPFK